MLVSMGVGILRAIKYENSGFCHEGTKTLRKNGLGRNHP
jgi:hypothetical protein